MSWLAEKDVKEGREALNFSEWGRLQQKTEDVPDVLHEGSMPPLSYRLIHSGARLPPLGGDGGGDNSGKGGGD